MTVWRNSLVEWRNSLVEWRNRLIDCVKEVELMMIDLIPYIIIYED